MSVKSCVVLNFNPNPAHMLHVRPVYIVLAAGHAIVDLYIRGAGP